MKFKLLDVNFNLPDGYVSSSGNRVILEEFGNNQSSQISLDNSKEPTIKSADGTVLFKGSNSNVSLDNSAESVSTSAKYSNGSSEFTFLVRKFVDPKQVCRALKSEVEKYGNVIADPKSDGYRANIGNGNHVLCYVQSRCLVIITTNDLANIDNVFVPQRSSWAIPQLIFGIALVLFALFALSRGVTHRIIFLIGIAAYFIYAGYTQMNKKSNDCPKF